MGLLSIDFGTTNTVAALMVRGQSPWLVTFDGSPSLPSAVFDTDGGLIVGRDAVRQARLDPARFEPNPKRRIDDGEILLGDRSVPVVEAIAAVLALVGAEARRQLGGAPLEQVRLTHPAGWGSARRNTLVSAARAAGLGHRLVLVPEPVAAAAQYTQLPGRALPAGSAVAVFDFGGGTLDVAVVGRHDGEFGVLAEGGLTDLGGLDFDQAVLEQVGRQISGADPARWQQIMRQSDLSTRRAGRALAEDVRAAKESLSRHSQTEIPLPDPFGDAHLTRVEFEGLIRPQLARAVEALRETVRRSGVAREHLAEIFLVGGSSRIPLVAGLIQQQLGVIPVALDHPETAVALGAGQVPITGHGLRTEEHSAARGAIAGGGYPPASVTRPPASPSHHHPSPPQPPTGPGWPAPPQPRPAPAASANRRRRWWIGGGAAAAIVAVVATLVLVFEWPFGGGGPRDGAEFAADVRTAMAGTRTASGTLLGGEGTATFRQTMADGRQQAVEIAYSVSTDSGSMPITIRVVEGQTYLGGGAIRTLIADGADGKQWVLLDGTSGDETVDAFGQALAPIIGLAGTASYVHLLSGATLVQESGQETIGGVAATRYLVQIDVDKAAAAMPDQLSGYRELLSGVSGVAEAAYWLDDSDRIVKAEVTMPDTDQRTSITVDAYDRSFSLAAPDPATVYTG